MECKEVQRKIKNFIEDDLESREMLTYIEHIRNCPDCKEELSIEFLVVTGLQRLDSAESFDLQNELEDKIRTNEETALQKIKMSRIVFLLAIFAAVVAGYFISTFFY